MVLCLGRAGFSWSGISWCSHPHRGCTRDGGWGGGRLRSRVGALPTLLGDLTCVTGGGVVALVGRLLPSGSRKEGRMTRYTTVRGFGRCGPARANRGRVGPRGSGHIRR